MAKHLDWPSGRSDRVGQRVPAPVDHVDFKLFRRNSESLRFKIPEQLNTKLVWLSQENEISRTDVVRALLFRHLYGEPTYELFLAVDKSSPTKLVDPAEEEIRRSPARDYRQTIAHVGKSTVNVDLDVPFAMYADIEELARIATLTVPEWCRRALVICIFGQVASDRWIADLSGPEGA